MGLGANFQNSNDDIAKKLVLDFVQKPAVKKDEESKNPIKSGQSENTPFDSLTVVREMDDGYVVRITQTNKVSGKKTVQTEFISRKAFEAGIRAGYLKPN